MCVCVGVLLDELLGYSTRQDIDSLAPTAEESGRIFRRYQPIQHYALLSIDALLPTRAATRATRQHHATWFRPEFTSKPLTHSENPHSCLNANTIPTTMTGFLSVAAGPAETPDSLFAARVLHRS